MKTKNSEVIKKTIFHTKIKFLLTLIMLFFFIANSYTETITFSADSMSGTVNDNLNYTRLTGNAYVKTDSMELEADEIELNGEDYRYIIAKGSITGTYSEAGFTFTCESLIYDREEEIAILESDVDMKDTENDVDLKAEFIEYNQNTKVALIQIDVEIIQDKSVCTAAFALYRKDIQILELSGSPKITQEDDVFQAHEIIFDLDTEEITLLGRVQGTVTDTSDENDDDSSSNVGDKKDTESDLTTENGGEPLDDLIATDVAKDNEVQSE